MVHEFKIHKTSSSNMPREFRASMLDGMWHSVLGFEVSLWTEKAARVCRREVRWVRAAPVDEMRVP